MRSCSARLSRRRWWQPARRWPTRVADEDGFLALHAGIHHGSAVHRDNDYFGHDVNIAARVTALTGAGQGGRGRTRPTQLRTVRSIADPAGPQAFTQHRQIGGGVRPSTDSRPQSQPAPVCRAAVDPRSVASHLRHADRD